MKIDTKTYIQSGWLSKKESNVKKYKSAEVAKKRRTKLFKLLTHDILIKANTGAPSSELVERKFRPNSDFVYLTGMPISDISDSMVLLIGKNNKAELYMNPPYTKESAKFFTDTTYGEYWTGPSDDLKAVAKKTGTKTRQLSELKIKTNNNAGRIINKLRLEKDEYEISELKKAIEYTKIALDKIVKNMKNYTYEKDIEADFNATAIKYGGGIGFNTIVGSGENSTYLHWVKNSKKIMPNDIVVVDAGVQTNEMYTSDITRTFPVSGKFSDAQKMVYEAVLDTNTKAISLCKNGTLWKDVHNFAVKNVSKYLALWGIINTSEDEIYEKELYKRYMVHGIGHPLGLDVHDNLSLTDSDNENLVIKNGHVMTIEPGIYFRTDDKYVPKELRGIGIRIEDDILITKDKPIVLSNKIPKTVAEIEKWFKDLS